MKWFNCTCFVCGDKFHRAKNQIERLKDKRLTCSKECALKKQSIINKEKIENKLGIKDFKKWLDEKYHMDRLNSGDIAEIVYGKRTHSPNIIGWMKRLKVDVRSRSEAVSMQWENNDDRKAEAIKTLTRSMAEGTKGRKRLIQVMQTDKYKEKQSISKTGPKNGMFGITGENHPKWNPNRTKDQRIRERKTAVDRNWKISVIIRDGRSCAVCGDSKSKIVVHHMNSYHWDIKNRYNPDNGVVMCDSCHKDFHKKYGYRNNTEKQFHEYAKHHTKNKSQQLSLL